MWTGHQRGTWQQYGVYRLKQAIPLRSVVLPSARGPVHRDRLESECSGQLAPATTKRFHPEVRQSISDSSDSASAPPTGQGFWTGVRSLGDFSDEGLKVRHAAVERGPLPFLLIRLVT